MALTIGAGECVGVCGPKGEGKTNLIMATLEPLRSWVVMDSKQDPGEWPVYARKRGVLVTEDPEMIRRHARVVLQVSALALEDREGWKREGSAGWAWTRANMLALQRGNTRVVFDEALQTLPSSGGNPHARRIFQQGRSLRVPATIGTQMVTWMDTMALRLLDWLICFRLDSAEQRTRLAQARGVDCEALANLPPHHFGAHRLGSTSWELFRPAPLMY